MLCPGIELKSPRRDALRFDRQVQDDAELACRNRRSRAAFPGGVMAVLTGGRLIVPGDDIRAVMPAAPWRTFQRMPKICRQDGSWRSGERQELQLGMSRRSRLIVVAIWTLMAPLSYTPSGFRNWNTSAVQE